MNVKYYLVYGFYPVEVFDMLKESVCSYFHTNNVMEISEKDFDFIFSKLLDFTLIIGDYFGSKKEIEREIREK